MSTIKPSDISSFITSLNTLSSKSKVTITNATLPSSGSIAQKVTIDRLTTAINKLEESFSNNCCQSVNNNCCQTCQSCQTTTCQSTTCQSCQTQSCQSCQHTNDCGPNCMNCVNCGNCTGDSH